jgi:hypothetical protein
MDHEGRRVKQPDIAALQDLALLADPDQIRLLDQREGDSERIHPERGFVYRIPNRDVASNTCV